jgi:segregation and condensation protein B
MELSQIIPHIEALIFASDKPLTNMDLVELLNNAMGFIEDRANLDQVESAVEGIHEKYSAEFYAFELKQSGGGWQFLTKKEYHKTVAQLNGDKFLKRLSNAALETLAIIAYKQPITKSEIESIRGVNCDYAVQKLLEKDLVVISGRNEEAVGKPLIYSTSKSFMDYFGINSTDDLPKISEVLMEELVQATIVNQEIQPEEDPSNLDESAEIVLAVTEDGEIIENVAVLSDDNEVEMLVTELTEVEIADAGEPVIDDSQDELVITIEEEVTVEDIVVEEVVAEEKQDETEVNSGDTPASDSEAKEGAADKQVKDEEDQAES